MCGLDELGFRTLEELRRLGEEVVIVARSPSEGFARAATGLGASLLQGNYRDESTLARAHIAGARAIVITEDDDVGNLHAALMAHDLNPRILIGLRLFNPELGERVRALVPDCLVLDPARIAAPAFVAAALHEHAEQHLRVWDRTLGIGEGSADDPSVVLPLAREHPDGTVELFPDGGQGLLSIVASEMRAPPEPAPRPLHRRAASRMRAILRTTDARLRYLAAALLLLAVLSIAVFGGALGLDLVDAIYFTVTVMTTTGFGDISLRDASPALQMYGVVLMVLGMSLLAIVFALATDALVGRRLAQELGRIPRSLRDHVVVCGLGNIGYRVVEEIHEARVPVAAAEVQADARFLPAARRLGVPMLIADGRLIETLEALHVREARCIVVVTNDDLANLATALNARALNPELRVVLRLFDPDFAVRVERAFGIHISRSPSALAAPAFAAAAEGREVIATIPVGVRALEVAEARVEPGSSADGREVGALERTVEARVLALRRHSETRWRPTPRTRLTAGDELIVVATRNGFAQVLEVTRSAVAAGASTDANGASAVAARPPLAGAGTTGRSETPGTGSIG